MPAKSPVALCRCPPPFRLLPLTLGGDECMQLWALLTALDSNMRMGPMRMTVPRTATRASMCCAPSALRVGRRQRPWLGLPGSEAGRP